jgi:superfamily II DNA or RNA helicase/HKD family nuclease
MHASSFHSSGRVEGRWTAVCARLFHKHIEDSGWQNLAKTTDSDCRGLRSAIARKVTKLLDWQQEYRVLVVGLRDLEYQEDYRSGYDDILNDFLRPALREANTYWRAVGYFSSSALEAFGTPLGEFVKNGGNIRLVTSVELSEADLEAIQSGVSKQAVCERRLERLIEEQFTDGVGDGVARLGLLLEMGRLEIQIAVPKRGTGIYHEKIGLFFDNHDFVAFSGSSNESRRAFESNRECIDVYPSWDSPSRARRKREHFEELWNHLDQGVYVYSFPEAAARKLLHICQEYRSGRRTEKTEHNKWRHQDEALEIFLKAKRGVLNMATGTGKTHTALKILEALFETNEIDTAIVTMDGNDLLGQWYGELLATRKQLPTNVHLYRDYDVYKEVQDFSLVLRKAILLVSRSGGRVRDPLRSALRQLTPTEADRTLLIHDEVHRLGSPGNRERLTGLSDQIRFRLGLSATPEREYDAAGNRFIEEHIGPELMRYELGDAIKHNILAPFHYFPLRYELTDEDRERVRDVYRKQAARAAAGDPMADEEVWIEIARVYKTSRAKLPVFVDFIKSHKDLLKRCIIFVETREFGEEVLEIVHRYRADFHTYFTGEQAATLRRFARGDLECLITCHRVSEGIDIRSLNSVILFSSARARLETIQRMGRCLRTDPANPGKIANVVDFVRTSGGGEDPNADEERCAWLTGLSTVRAEEIGSGS